MAQMMRMLGGEGIFVPGTDPAKILADANEYLADEWDEIATTPIDDIKISWWRVNPCSPDNCNGDGPHNGHWVCTGEQTRGGFQGAMLELAEHPESIALGEAVKAAR